MKVLIVLCAMVAVACAEVTLQQVFQAKWNNFKAVHGKEYPSHEEPKKLQAFLENCHHVETHNEKFAKGHVSFELGHNAFADMPHSEFKAKMMGFKMPPPHAAFNQTVFEPKAGLSLPASVDWRSATPRVKNQGQCGSCYTFAAAAAMEGALSRRYNRQFDLSEQNMVDCTASYGNYGCNGGFMNAAFKYVKENGGINDQTTYPYEGVQRQCRYKPSNRAGTISNYVTIRAGDEAGLTQALATVGPVAIAVDASPRTFMLYTRGIFDEPACNPQKLSHAITAVGYGVENGREYYLVKNSWGTGWGEGGYIRIARNRNNMCGITNMASYPVV